METWQKKAEGTWAEGKQVAVLTFISDLFYQTSQLGLGKKVRQTSGSPDICLRFVLSNKPNRVGEESYFKKQKQSKQ